MLKPFNRLGLCTSYKGTKLHRKNLAKLAISRSNDTGIPLPTHFSKSEFTIAAMDNFDHSDFSSLTGTAGTHDTAMTLFQIKPESCCLKPLKSEIYLKDISKLDDFSLNVLKNSKLVANENLPA